MDVIRLVQTCEACPEQYDAFVAGTHMQVGYLRLRWGYFTVTCPDVGGEEVYEAEVGNGYTGSFESDEQRAEQLDNAKAAIAKWLASRIESREDDGS